MSRETRGDQVDDVRRKLLKTSMAAGGFLAAGHLPYSKPALRSFFGVRSAWAQMSTFMTQFTGALPILPLGVGTGQDAWEFTTTQANTTLTINVMVTSGAAIPEIGLFAPGVATTGTNLITGNSAGHFGAFPVVIMVGAVGTYTLAIEDENANAVEVAFSYQIDVNADKPIIPGGQVIADGSETLVPASGG